MKYKVDGWNNFCRVFELPDAYPIGYCFGGGHRVNFQLVDWFYPVPGISMAAVSKEVWKEKVGKIEITEIDLDVLEKEIVTFLKQKEYVKPGKQYLIIYDFGGSTIFKGMEDK